MKSFFALESCWMYSEAQWWFVITSPFGDTSEPLQPSARRTDERRT